MKSYVYQFAFALNEEKSNSDEIGLMFSSEMDKEDYYYSFRFPVFAIKTNASNEIYFPGELNGRYQNFKVDRNRNGYYVNPKFSNSYRKAIKFKRLSYFEDFDVYDWIDYRKFFPFSSIPLKYFGNKKDIINNEDEFEIIVPSDLLYLDELYKEYKFCLVGYTPIFNDNERE